MVEPVQVERGTESPVESGIERARLIEQMLQEDRRDAAWDYYLRLHPSDRAEALTELRGGLRRSLASEMALETVAGLLEYLEPRISARMLREYKPAGLAEVLDLADPGLRRNCWSSCPRGSGRRLLIRWSPPPTLKRFSGTRMARLADSLTRKSRPSARARPFPSPSIVSV